MAVHLRTASPVDHLPSEPTTVRDAPKGPLAAIAQLAALHDEAAETARLANLLGRTPWLAAALALAAGVAVMSAHAELAPLVTWLVLVGAGLTALLRAYGITIAAPFAREPLRVFSRDLVAIMLYAGFAWGTGCFLALPEGASLLSILAFSGGVTLLAGLVLRAPEALASFAAPVAGLAAAAAVIRPFDSGIFASIAVIVAGVLLTGATFYLERVFLKTQNPHLAVIPLH